MPILLQSLVKNIYGVLIILFCCGLLLSLQYMIGSQSVFSMDFVNGIKKLVAQRHIPLSVGIQTEKYDHSTTNGNQVKPFSCDGMNGSDGMDGSDGASSHGGNGGNGGNGGSGGN